MFGLSVMKIIFDDDVEDFFARQQVTNLLRNVNLPKASILMFSLRMDPQGKSLDIH
jgi:Cu/Ag efflux pump CusA